MKYALRAVSSALILAFMLAALGALAVVIVLVVATLLFIAFMAGGKWAVGAGLVVVGILAAVALGLRATRRHLRTRAVGVPIAPDVQPLFWVDIYRVADGLGLRSPDEVLIFPDTKVTAWGHRTWLGLRPGGRRLHLGLPLLAGLTEQELRAVVAHAFCRSWDTSRLLECSNMVRLSSGRSPTGLARTRRSAGSPGVTVARTMRSRPLSSADMSWRWTGCVPISLGTTRPRPRSVRSQC